MAFVLIFRKIFFKNFWPKLCRRKSVVILSTVLIGAFLVFGLHLSLSTQNKPKLRPKLLDNSAAAAAQPAVAESRPLVPGLRVVHLDLKGAPPRVSYLARLFPLMASFGANALLLEYEDMFPFSGPLSAIRAENAFSVSDIRTVLRLAEESGLEVIPLMQTFGHLEFALKLKQFSDLREDPSLPAALCPQNNDSWTFVSQIIDQMAILHPNSRFLHIGCDEVFQIASCQKCRLKDRDHLFLSHVRRVAHHVVERHSRIPLVWDDMLRQMSSESLLDSGLSQLGVEPVVWSYVKDVYRFISPNQWTTFGSVFRRFWGASAFKGAFGETLTVPNAKWHLDNNVAWLHVLSDQTPVFSQIRGLVLTGWQRYDHLASLCELLPAAIPSLALSLITVSFGYFDSNQVFSRFDRVLHCPPNGRPLSDTELDADPNLFRRASACDFPGSGVFRLMETHSQTVKRVSDFLFDVTIHKAWLTDYNIRHNMTNPWRVDEGLQDYSSVYYSLQSLVRTAKAVLQEVYDEWTVAEWIEQNIYPSILRMETLMNASIALKKATHWPRRPLPIPEDLLRRLKDN
ncbi:hexosaminidase D-like isoform X2 [Oppia nitens]|uniref:hexosaminidase D-like isoform X2 n=1 Tax=Oppia nitens TaxID=1686743 RepID=UPI0023DC4729|nr:hexosaminidase D-like isoform X2 [Oppia nitens]